jgi:hypothetical protein
MYRSVKSIHDPLELRGIQPTDLTDASVALPDEFPGIPGIRSDLMLADARIRAKGPAGRLGFLTAPSAERSAARTFGQLDSD